MLVLEVMAVLRPLMKTSQKSQPKHVIMVLSKQPINFQ